MRPKFPEVVDSTLLAAFRSCPTKARRAYFEHWKPKGESVHLVAGKAFAQGIESARRLFWEDQLTDEHAMALALGDLLRAYGDFECPADSPKSALRVAGALEFYLSQYPLATSGTPVTFASGKRGIEFSFCEPLPILHPETGNPILYSGRADAILEFAGGTWICDEKTTSQLGASWSSQWDLRSQFTAYCWAAQRCGVKVDGVIVRGVSILKTQYDTQQVLTYRSEWEIARWLNQTCRDLNRMIQCWQSGEWDYNLDNACAEYGGCQFRRVCRSNEPEIWLPMDFERKLWDPLTRTETLLDAG